MQKKRWYRKVKKGRSEEVKTRKIRDGEENSTYDIRKRKDLKKLN